MKYRSDLDIRITDDQRQLLLGTLLGDASCVLQKRSANPYIRVSHSLKDIEYTRWKYSYLFSSNLLQSSVDKYGSFNTIQHPRLWEFRALFYPNGVKVVTAEILQLIRPLGIAVWYMDDGSIIRRISRSPGPYCVLAVQSFTVGECEMVKQWFADTHNIEFRLYERQKKGYDRVYPELWTTKIKEGAKFFDLVDPYIPECMKRKKWR